MTAIAQELDRKLKKWRPATVRKVTKLVEEIIALADREPAGSKSPSNGKPKRKIDHLLDDNAVFNGDVPRDSSTNHDRYLYD